MSLKYNPLLFFGFDDSGAPPVTPGANTALSNLTSPTAINQDLLPGVTNTRAIGSSSKGWNNIIVNAASDLLGRQSISIDSRALVDESGNDKIGWSGGGLSLFTVSNNEMLFAPNGTGQLRFNDNSVGISGQVWTSTDAFGRGHWAAASSGVTTMAAVGAVPNANGASISGSTLTLQPANLTNPGLMTTGSQTFGGTKTFDGSILSNNTGLTVGSSGQPWANVFGVNMTVGSNGSGSGLITLKNGSNVNTGFITAESTMSSSGSNVSIKISSSGSTLNAGMDTPDVGTLNINSGSVFIETGDQTNVSTSTGTSGSIAVKTGNNAGTGPTGGISFATGTTGGARGKIKLVDGTEGSANAIWTSSDNAGNGNWVGPGATGTFTTTDLKTVTVTNGIITSIV